MHHLPEPSGSRARRATLVVIVLAVLGTAGVRAQSTFFSVYDPGTGAWFNNLSRCANGDLLAMSEDWFSLMRTDSVGNVLWYQHAQGFQAALAGAPLEDSNGDLLMVTAQYDTANARYQPALARLDASGAVLSLHRFPVDTLEFWPWRRARLTGGKIASIATAWNAQEVVVTLMNPAVPSNVAMHYPVNFPLQGNQPAGYTGVFAGLANTFFTYHGSYQPTLILSKYGSFGNVQWQRSYEVDGGISAIGMAGATLNNGDLVLLVKMLGSPLGSAAHLLLLDPAGGVISAKVLYSGQAFDWRGHVVPMPDGSFVVHLGLSQTATGGDVLLHFTAGATVIAQYGVEPGFPVQDVKAVGSNRLALICGPGLGGAPTSLSVMAFDQPLPSCWVPDSVFIAPVTATDSFVVAPPVYVSSLPVPTSMGVVPLTMPRTPLCGSTFANEAAAQDEWRLFPSPAEDGIITVQAPVSLEGETYEVVNALGALCGSGRLPADGRSDLGYLPRGAYVMRLHDRSTVHVLRFQR